MHDAISRTTDGKFRQAIEIGPHSIGSDEPTSAGGDDSAPAPHELLEAALAACTSMTVKMYAERKGWPLRSVEVRVHIDKSPEGNVLRRTIRLHGALDEEQRVRLLDIAGKCPVHKTLASNRIESSAEVAP